MELKKHPSKDIRNKRLDFTLIGLSVALAITLLAFEYTTPPEEDTGPITYEINEDIEIMEKYGSGEEATSPSSTSNPGSDRR